MVQESLGSPVRVERIALEGDTCPLFLSLFIDNFQSNSVGL